MFQTQKARGYRIITEIGLENQIPWLSTERAFNVLPYNMPPYFDGPFFARPCPETPRHGFVESRKVNNLQELLEVFVETRTADPKGEVLIMKPLSGKASAIAMESGVTWGKNNDGATGGKGPLWNIPCPAGEFTKRILFWSSELKKDIKGSAYLEIVENDGKPTLVQLRDGPMVPKSSGNYVPRVGYEVTELLAPSNEDYMDLLAWERKCKAAKPGTVVIDLKSLTNHLAVQAICHGLAVWTAKVGYPQVGTKINPDRDQPDALRRKDYLFLRNALKKRMHVDKKSAVPLCIATLHAMPLWGREPHLLKLRAYAVVTMLRLLSAACIGEDRHYYRCGPGSNRKKDPPGKSRVNWDTLLGVDPAFAARTAVHDAVLPKSIAILHDLMVACEADFRERGWETRSNSSGSSSGTEKCSTKSCAICYPDGYDAYLLTLKDKAPLVEEEERYSEENYGYGGPKWARSAGIAKDLARALLNFKLRPRKEEWDAVVSAYNKGVMAAHNGGKALDKFCDWSFVDLCAKAPQWGFIGRMAMEIVADTKAPDIIVKKKAKGGAPEKVAEKEWPWNKPPLTLSEKKMIEEAKELAAKGKIKMSSSPAEIATSGLCNCPSCVAWRAQMVAKAKKNLDAAQAEDSIKAMLNDPNSYFTLKEEPLPSIEDFLTPKEDPK